MTDANTSPATGDDAAVDDADAQTPTPEASENTTGVTRAASRVVHGVADTGKGAIHKVQDAAKDALPDAVPDVADKIVDAAAGFATARIDQNVTVVDGALTLTRRTGKAARIAAVIGVVAVVALLIARRS
ncbi:hypothetical protein PUW79_08655 [Microbacterium sp. NE2HP2]|uniref:hypothetical protein n=1 Tax=Microbacterium TaxID=33882 RepID=UPI0023673050|nr:MULTISPECIES: hypothetical protein [Microbacterium]MDD7944697.1 hypothetical protein [Microbacterium plantarum]WHE35049.1 hypothetical protein P6897_10090 [Microbacterium sp. BDGP8]WRK16212.1 hypothetical protein VC184_09800 [Microbacterium plantarum]